nr:pyridoxamine 5'-phosphate oxidase family protein [Pseudonocardia sp. C8]
MQVQHKAGLTAEAARLVGILHNANISDGMRRFLADQDFAVITSRAADGRLWTSPLYGVPGFCAADGAALRVAGRPRPGDPLHGLQRGSLAGMLVLDFQRRRRLRVNGLVGDVGGTGFELAADQTFGNCPQYIQQQVVEPVGESGNRFSVTHHTRLEAEHAAQVKRADTFFLGTAHPTHGIDASHRGGSPGFVRVEADELWWPDYPGNNLFNSMGNIAVNPEASLLFIDFHEGTSLQFSGEAYLDWHPPGVPGDDSGTGRRVRFLPLEVVRTVGIPFRSVSHEGYSRNPAIT